MKKTCIFQDTDNTKKTADLLEVARRMYGNEPFESHAVILEGPSDEIYGAFHHIIRLSAGLVEGFDSRGICDVLENLHQTNTFDSILIPATCLGEMIAPRLAVRLQTGLAAGVTDIGRNGDRIAFIRPACSGKRLQGLEHTGEGPVVMSIRPNAFEYTSGGGVETEMSEYTQPVTSRTAVKRLHSEANKQTYDIRDSEVLISGGNGVKDCFPKLYPLADALNGTVAASRKLVDQGIAPRQIQVGQSGKTVSPRLYMALGIHGSMPHMAGLRQIETIISVNRSSHAPVCSLSDIVVQGDAAEFIDKLMAKMLSADPKKKDR